MRLRRLRLNEPRVRYKRLIVDPPGAFSDCSDWLRNFPLTAIQLSILALALVACGGGDDDNLGADAEAATEEYLSLYLKQQGGPAYDWIVPEQAGRIPRETFIRCVQESANADMDIEAVESYTETLDVAELGSVETWALTVKATAGERSTNLTRHLIERDGRFYSLFDAAQIDTYAARECP